MRRPIVLLLSLAATCSMTATHGGAAGRDRTNASTPVQQPCAGANAEVFVPAGRYEPFFKRSEQRSLSVGPMCAGAAPVTNAEYLAFVREHPEWRKSRVKEVFAEDSYLSDWRDDLAPPNGALAQPVTYVSWFAAGAFCETHGGRLPKVAEWERFAGADAATQAPEQRSAEAANEATPFAFAMGHPRSDLAATPLVLRGIWEWTDDFNSSVVSGRLGNAQDPDATMFCGDGFRAVDPSNYAAFLRYSFRSSLRGNFALRNLGFRCVREAT